MKFKGPEKNEILTPFIVMSLLRKIGNKEIDVKKIRNFVLAEFVKSGIHYVFVLEKNLSFQIQKCKFYFA